MHLEDKIFYRAITALHFLFIIFVLNIFYWMSSSVLGLLDKDLLFVFFLSLIVKESLIYIAYGKDALWKKWKRTTNKAMQFISHFSIN